MLVSMYKCFKDGEMFCFLPRGVAWMVLDRVIYRARGDSIKYVREHHTHD